MSSLIPQLKKGLDYLYEIQTSEGNFPDSIYFIKEKKWNNTPATIFSTALIIHMLLNIQQNARNFNPDICNKCGTMINKSFDFFISEMAMPGLWRFGMRSDNRWNSLPFDTDDTCCVSYLLKNYHPYIYFGMNKPLIMKNRNAKGLFFTWLVPQGSSVLNDVDLVVNVNALLYLGENKFTKDVIEHICEMVISKPYLVSLYYYTDELCLYYMISRAYAAGVKGFYQCRDVIQERLYTREISNTLHSAMVLCTLLNLNFPAPYPSALICNILDNQSTEGSWEKYPLYQGEVYPNPPAVLFGSKALTTAVCLEALSGMESNKKMNLQ